VLQPQRRIRRPRGPFPDRANHQERLPEPVLERVVAPLGGRVMKASAWVRRRQHGRLQDYILYLVAGLAGVALLVFAWSL
jgi:hydrogenase-4 component B